MSIFSLLGGAIKISMQTLFYNNSYPKFKKNVFYGENRVFSLSIVTLFLFFILPNPI